VTTAAVAIAYFLVALGNGGYATTAVAWGVIAIWAVVAIGIAIRAWPPTELEWPALIAGACLAGLAAFSALSLIWADDAGRAFAAALLPAGYAGLFVLVVLAAPATGARSWLVGLAIGTSLTIVAALAARLDPGFLGATDHGVAFLPGSQGRLNYPIGYWNGLAACVAIGVILLVWLGARAETRLGRSAAVAMLPLGGLAIFLTSSRGGAAAVVVGFAVVLLIGPRRPQLLTGAALGGAASVVVILLARGRSDLIDNLGTSTARDQGLEIAAVAAFLAVAVGAIRWFVDERLARVVVPPRARTLGWAAAVGAAIALVAIGIAHLGDFSSTGEAGSATPGQRSFLSGSGSGRAQFWGVALDAFGSKPLTGIGAGNYELYWNAHPKIPVVTGNAHSYFLEALADLGPIGFLLTLGPFAAAVVAVWKRWRRALPELAPALALMAGSGLAAAIDWTWKIPAAFAPTVIAIALLTGGAVYRRPALALVGRRAPRRLSSFGLGVATLLFAWGAGWIAGVELIASGHLTDSHDAVSRGDLTAAASDARAAASVEPFSSAPPLQLALVEELAGNRHAARTAALEAISKAPQDWQGWAVLSRIDRELGLRGRAGRAEFRAQSLSPVTLPPSVFRPRR
jgi:hypothetical protein